MMDHFEFLDENDLTKIRVLELCRDLVLVILDWLVLAQF